MKPLLALLVILLLVLQYKIWIAPGGVVSTIRLHRQINAEQQKNQQLEQRNAVLMADITALKHGKAAIESRARNDLGMIKHGEVYYQIVQK